MSTQRIRAHIERAAEPQRGVINRVTADALLRTCDEEDAASQPPVPEVTERGFQRHAPIPSEYGGEVSVYESSAASGPHIWLRAVAPASLNNPRGPTVEAPMHLTLENATLLRNQLTQLIENHYQNGGQ